MIANLMSLNFMVPGVAARIDFSRSIRGLRGMPRRLLLLGIKTNAGTAATNTFIPVSTEADAVAQFGEGSMLAAMWRAARKNLDGGLPVDCMALAPAGAGGSNAGSLLVIQHFGGSSATFTLGGELAIYIGGERVVVGVTAADTQATVATKLIAAINAKPSLPVFAAATLQPNQVQLTCRWLGPTGNEIDVRTAYYPEDRLPADMILTVPPMTFGQVGSDMSAAIAAMQSYRATEIVCPFTDALSMGLLEAEMAARWQANNMQDGAVVTCVRGTEAQLSTWLSTRNSPHVHTIAVTKDVTNPWETAAMAGAAIESLASVDPAMPQTGVPLLGYRGPQQSQHWTRDQANNMLLQGASPLNLLQDGSAELWRMVTNYTLSSGGAEDRSMGHLCWLKTMSYYRWFHVSEFATKYRGFKLAQYITEPVVGQKIMTVQLAQEIMIGLYKVFMDAGLCQHMPHYAATLVVEVDGPNGRLRIQDEPVLVVQHYQTEMTSYAVAGQV